MWLSTGRAHQTVLHQETLFSARDDETQWGRPVRCPSESWVPTTTSVEARDARRFGPYQRFATTKASYIQEPLPAIASPQAPSPTREPIASGMLDRHMETREERMRASYTRNERPWYLHTVSSRSKDLETISTPDNQLWRRPQQHRVLVEPSIIPSTPSPRHEATNTNVHANRKDHDRHTVVATPEIIPPSSSIEKMRSPNTTLQVPKQSRYLRELDRRRILARLDKGERQSALAKEYGVSRSTICNLFRQRDVVLARTYENPLARHPKKARKPFVPKNDEPTTIALLPNALEKTPPQVIEIESRAITLLKQTLQNQRTSPDEFKRCRTRLMRLLIEESVAVATVEGQQKRGSMVPVEACVCAASMETADRAMLDAFRSIEPRAPSGVLPLVSHGIPHPDRLTDSSLPLRLHGYEVLLLEAVAGAKDSVHVAIDILLQRGATEETIILVALFVSAEVVAFLQHAYPCVRILTTDRDASLNAIQPVESSDPDPDERSTWRPSRQGWTNAI